MSKEVSLTKEEVAKIRSDLGITKEESQLLSEAIKTLDGFLPIRFDEIDKEQREYERSLAELEKAHLKDHDFLEKLIAEIDLNNGMLLKNKIPLSVAKVFVKAAEMDKELAKYWNSNLIYTEVISKLGPENPEATRNYNLIADRWCFNFAILNLHSTKKQDELKSIIDDLYNSFKVNNSGIKNILNNLLQKEKDTLGQKTAIDKLLNVYHKLFKQGKEILYHFDVYYKEEREILKNKNLGFSLRLSNEKLKTIQKLSSNNNYIIVLLDQFFLGKQNILGSRLYKKLYDLDLHKLKDDIMGGYDLKTREFITKYEQFNQTRQKALEDKINLSNQTNTPIVIQNNTETPKEQEFKLFDKNPNMVKSNAEQRAEERERQRLQEKQKPTQTPKEDKRVLVKPIIQQPILLKANPYQVLTKENNDELDDIFDDLELNLTLKNEPPKAEEKKVEIQNINVKEKYNLARHYIDNGKDFETSINLFNNFEDNKENVEKAKIYNECIKFYILKDFVEKYKKEINAMNLDPLLKSLKMDSSTILSSCETYIKNKRKTQDMVFLNKNNMPDFINALIHICENTIQDFKDVAVKEIGFDKFKDVDKKILRTSSFITNNIDLFKKFTGIAPTKNIIKEKDDSKIISNFKNLQVEFDEIKDYEELMEKVARISKFIIISDYSKNYD